MSVNRVKLTNWMNISECDLTFNDGINLIQGAVGEGKSSVFAAIAYALSDYKRGDTWKDYIKTGEKSFEIELTYQFGNDPDNVMVITCKGESNKGSVYRELLYKNELKKGEEVTQLLSTKLDQQMLNAVVFNLQGGQQLSEMTPAERRDIFKKIFNSDFSDIVEVIKQDRDELQRTLDKLTAQIDVLKNKEYSFFRIIPVDEAEVVKLQDELKLAHLSESLELRMNQYLDKVNQLNTLQNKQGKEKENHENLITKLAGHKVTLISLKKKIEESTYEVTAKKELWDHTRNELTIAKDSLEAFKGKAEVDTKDIEEQIIQATTRLIEARTELGIAKKHLEAHKKGVCDSCGQTCDVTKVAEFQAEIDTLTEDQIGIETFILEHQNDLKGIKATLIEKKDLVTSLTLELQKREATYNSLMVQVKAYTIEKETIENEAIPHMENTIATCNRNVQEYTVDITSLQLWLESNTRPKEVESKDANAIQKAIDVLYEKIQGNINRKKMNTDLEKEQADDGEMVNTLNLKLNSSTVKLSQLATVSKIFSIDFPNFISGKASKILEGHINTFISQAKENMEVAIQNDKKGVSFYYKSNKEPDWRNIKMLSGFENALITLSFNLAISSMYGMDFILLDEPEANGDPLASHHLFEVIKGVHSFKQMFVITHKEDIVDSLLEDGKVLCYVVKKGHFEKRFA